MLRSSNSNTVVRFMAIVILPLIFVACFATSCQPTPTTPIVQGKGSDLIRNIEENSTKATNSNIDTIQSDDNRAADSFRSDENWEDMFNINNCSVTIKASIVYPSITQIPAVKVKPYCFSEKDIDNFMSVFFPGMQVSNYTSITKETLEKELLYYKKLLIDLKEGQHPADDLRSIDVQIDDCMNKIKELETQLSNITPDIPQKLDKSFRSISSVDSQAQFIGKLGVKDYLLTVNNEEGIGSSMVFEYSGLNVSKLSKFPENAADNFDDASKLADNYISALGITDQVLIEKTHVSLRASEIGTTQPVYGYMLKYVRSYGGIAPIKIDGAPKGLSSLNSKSEQYGRRAYTESITIITDGTQLFWLEWDYPYTVDALISGNVKTIDKDKATSIATAQLNRILADKESTKLLIDRFELSGAYLTIKDEPDIFLIVPVWDLIGYQTFEDGRRYLGSKDDPLSFVTINAVDGSIIDRELGY